MDTDTKLVKSVGLTLKKSKPIFEIIKVGKIIQIHVSTS